MSEPVARFVLPLSVAPLTNALMRMHHGKVARLKHEAFMRMLAQIGRRKTPLEGRPRIVLVRQSSSPADPDSGLGAKLILDCLKCDRRQGLGWIRDDGPDAIELDARWQRAAPSRGQVVVEIHGEPEERGESDGDDGRVEGRSEQE